MAPIFPDFNSLRRGETVTRHRKASEVFERSREKVERRWAHMQWRDSGGGVCLMQSVYDTLGIRNNQSIANLPSEIVDAMHDELYQTSFGYRRIYKKAVRKNFGSKTNRVKIHAMTKWNDSLLRSKQDVIRLLSSLEENARTSEQQEQLKASEVERNRLRKRVEYLTTEVTLLRERIAELEAENSRLKQLTSAVTLKSDRKQLEDLETELSQAWDNLKDAQTVA